MSSFNIQKNSMFPTSYATSSTVWIPGTNARDILRLTQNQPLTNTSHFNAQTGGQIMINPAISTSIFLSRPHDLQPDIKTASVTDLQLTVPPNQYFPGVATTSASGDTDFPEKPAATLSIPPGEQWSTSTFVLPGGNTSVNLNYPRILSNRQTNFRMFTQPSTVVITPVPGGFGLTTGLLTTTLTAGTTFGLPIIGGSDYKIEWGDGLSNIVNISTGTTDVITHIYAAGAFTLQISPETGVDLKFNFGNSAPAITANEIASITQWGDFELTANAFSGCSNFTGWGGGSVVPKVTETSLEKAFFQCFNLINIPSIGTWDVSSVKDMSQMFESCVVLNSDVNGLNVSSVEDMSRMFASCDAFNNAGISITFGGIGTTGNVTDMTGMFSGCDAFNVNVNGLDVSSVENMGAMFASCDAFNNAGNSITFEGGTGSSTTGNVTDMIAMFNGCDAFNVNVNGLDVSSVENMDSMFAGCDTFNNGGVALTFEGGTGSSTTGNVENMTGMFQTCIGLNVDVNGLDVSSVTDMSGMFQSCDTFNNAGNSITFGGIGTTGNVTNMTGMFSGCDAFNVNVNGLNVSSVESMSYMIAGCDAFNNGGVALTFEGGTGSSTTGNVTDMIAMFNGCDAFNVNVNGLDVSSVTDMNAMFNGCDAFNNGGVALTFEGGTGSSTTGNVENMSGMFQNCIGLNVNVNGLDVSSVTDMSGMFESCTAFDSGPGGGPADLNFNAGTGSSTTGNVKNMSRMFYNCDLLDVTIALNVSSVTDMSEMFADSDNLNSNINGLNVSSVTDMSRMFASCTAFNNNGGVPGPGPDLTFEGGTGSSTTGNVENMSGMFEDCTGLNSDVNGLNVSSVTNMSRMFASCTAFNNNGNSITFDPGTGSSTTGNVKNMSGMFAGCTDLTENLAITTFKDVTDMSGMFEGCTAWNPPIANWFSSAPPDYIEALNSDSDKGWVNIFRGSALTQIEFDGFIETLQLWAQTPGTIMPINIQWTGNTNSVGTLLVTNIPVGSAAEDAYNYLTSAPPAGPQWIITD